MNQFTLTAVASAASACLLLLSGCSSDDQDPVRSTQLKREADTAIPMGGSPAVHTGAVHTGAVQTGAVLSEARQANVMPVGVMHTNAITADIVDAAADKSAALPSPFTQHQSSPALTGADAGVQLHLAREQQAARVEPNREKYASLIRNATIQANTQPVSTFSIDVDTGAYSNIRRFLQNGQLPPREAVRVEELLNYFSYDYPNPTNTSEPFSVTTEMAPAPWNSKTHLLRIGLKGYVPPTNKDTPANLVFLVDVSGSMDSPDKLGLLKSSISMLAHELKASDTVSIAVYAGSSGTVLEPTPGNQHRKIDRALAQLTAGGSTNGAQGIELAYQLASEHFIEGGINRVIIATDGDFNVGISDVELLKNVIRQKRKSGIALSTLGFGTGNYNDELMEQLADVGNGSYAYIDTLGEARKVLVDELQATLLTIASDVKIQVEFNPALVSEYRLIGYSNRALANEDFTNDRVDAGEIGAGHTVTAIYELALYGEGGERHSPLRYGKPDDPGAGTRVDQQHVDPRLLEVAEVRLRYKLPGASNSLLMTHVVQAENRAGASAQAGTDDFRFSASVAAFGQLLQGEDRLANFDYQDARQLAAGSLGVDRFGYRAEFIRLLDLATSLDRLSRLEPGRNSPDSTRDEG